MAKVQAYIVVDDNNDMLGGPYLWNGEDEWTPPERGFLVLFDAWAEQFPEKAYEPNEQV